MTRSLKRSSETALPLAEAFIQMMRPSAGLIEVAKQKAASRGQEDWRVCVLDRAVAATTHIDRGHTPPSWVEEAAALLAGFRRLMVNGEARARGREGSLIGPERDLSAELWNHLEVRGDGTLEVPGAPPIRFYAMRVLLPATDVAVSGRRRDQQDDTLLKNKIESILAASKALWPDPCNQPTATLRARELVRRKKVQGYGVVAVKKILEGTYRPAKRLGIAHAPGNDT